MEALPEGRTEVVQFLAGVSGGEESARSPQKEPALREQVVEEADGGRIAIIRPRWPEEGAKACPHQGDTFFLKARVDSCRQRAGAAIEIVRSEHGAAAL